MTDHTPALCRNRLLSALPPNEPSQLRRYPMRMQRVNGQGLHEAGERIGQVFCVEQSFASMVTVADTDGDLLRTAVVLRWSPFFGQAVKLGLPDEKDGPDDGQAEAVWG